MEWKVNPLNVKPIKFIQRFCHLRLSIVSVNRCPLSLQVYDGILLSNTFLLLRSLIAYRDYPLFSIVLSGIRRQSAIAFTLQIFEILQSFICRAISFYPSIFKQFFIHKYCFGNGQCSIYSFVAHS